MAEAIRRAILEREFAPGDVLPPERSLAAQFQVTRNTVREALRALERARLLAIRQGSGARVLDYLSTAGLEFLAELLGTDEGGRTRLLRDLAEVRKVVGVALCHFAVDHLDRAALGSLREGLDAFRAEADRPAPDVRRLQELDYELHNRLVRAADNRAFILLHNSLNHVYRTVAHFFEPLMATPADLADHYEAVIDALDEGDAAEAKRVLTRVFELGHEAMLAATGEDGSA